MYTLQCRWAEMRIHIDYLNYVSLIVSFIAKSFKKNNNSNDNNNTFVFTNNTFVFTARC